MQLTSGAFDLGKLIPRKYSCDGEDVSPPFAWSDVPENTKSFALIADDPDAPGSIWVHWVMFNIPAESRGIKERIPPVRKLPDQSIQGINDFGKTGYGGPCPPGGTHRYFFRIYALDTSLEPNPSTTKPELLKKMEGHILAKAEYMGTYKRR